MTGPAYSNPSWSLQVRTNEPEPDYLLRLTLALILTYTHTLTNIRTWGRRHGPTVVSMLSNRSRHMIGS